MASLGINETQFVFTYFYHYLNLKRPSGIDFIFPSLRAEGNVSSPLAGADIVLRGNIFLQFKMPDYLRYGNSREIVNGKLPEAYKPYFRFNIKNERLSNVYGSGQFDLLKTKARKAGNIVKYVCPAFDGEKSHVYGRDNYWYLNFITEANSATALDTFVAEIDFKQFLHPRIKIGNTNHHIICYNHATILNSQKARMFSEEYEIDIKKGVGEFKKENGQLVFDDNNKMSLIETINDLRDFIKIDWKNESLSVNDIQQALIRQWDVFWLPIKDIPATRKEEINSIISKISNV